MTPSPWPSMMSDLVHRAMLAKADAEQLQAATGCFVCGAPVTTRLVKTSTDLCSLDANGLPTAAILAVDLFVCDQHADRWPL